MSFERKTYKGLEYLAWNGSPRPGPRPGLGEVSLFITPQNYHDAASRVADLHASLAFDTLTLNCPNGSSFTDGHVFEAFAPYVRELKVTDNCGRIDFVSFECFRELLSIVTLIPKPKGLRLAAYPKLWTATLGQVDRVQVLENALNLERLRLFRRLNLAKTGWNWLTTLPRLQQLVFSQFEVNSLQGLPDCGTVTRFTFAHPRGAHSIAGVEAFSKLAELEIEGAKQLHDYSPVANLKTLRHLAVIESGKPESLSFLRELPVLERAIVNGEEFIGRGSFRG